MQFHFYETLVVGEFASTTLGVQVFVSPPDPFGRGQSRRGRVDYSALLEDFEQLQPLRSAVEVINALPLIADPERDWQRGFSRDAFLGFGAVTPTREDLAFTDDLITHPLIAAEMSPLRQYTLSALVGAAGGGVLVSTGTAPMIVLIGSSVGFVALRGLAAVTGALWEGARPELVELSGDASALVFDAIRRRLNIPRRH